METTENEDTSISFNKAENEIKNKNKDNKNKNWCKLKRILMSSDKLTFLNTIVPIELNLFTKQTINNIGENVDKKLLKIQYQNVNEVLIKSYPNLLSIFIPLEIVQPNFNSSDQSNISYLLEKIDNTGNVQIWPSEDILSIYCLLNPNLFINKSIIELGSGFSGLCGLIIAKNIPSVKEIVITDGNSKCIEEVNKNILLNNLPSDLISSKVLLWDRNFNNYSSDDKNKFNIVLISDCLFFKNYHVDLIDTIDYLLSQNGMCIIVTPPRGDTMELFIKLAEEKLFNVEKNKDEIDFLNSTKEGVEKNKFCPFYIKMTKK